MKPQFREDKTTEAAALLLTMRGGQMSYMKVVKLLYLADREALLWWGRPITFDSYVAMDRGPVLSRTLNLITDSAAPGQVSVWKACVSDAVDYEVQLQASCAPNHLSEAEVGLLEEIYQRFGKLSRWQLVDFVHTLPEWTDPKGSALSISYRDILKAGGRTDAEARVIEDEIEELAVADYLLGK